MNTTDKRVRGLATEVSEAFERRERAEGETFVTLRGGSPEWMEELCNHAHGDMMPDDWRYEMIEDAVDAIAEASEDADLDDVGAEMADGVSVYTHDNLRWLASRTDRYGYVDEARENFGTSEESVTGDIRMGEYAERLEVFGLVLDFLRSMEDAA